MHVHAEASTDLSPASSARAGKLLVLVLGTLTALAPLAIDMYLPALPKIAQDVHVELGEVQQTLSVFLIGMAVGQAFYGPLADRFGRRVPLMAGMILFAIASFACARAQTMNSLLFWRLLMALGGSAGMVIPRAIVRDLFNQRESTRVYALLMLILGVSPILAPLIGAQLITLSGWRSIFVALAVVGVGCVVASIWAAPESLPVEKRSKGGVGLALRTYWQLLTDRRFIGPTLASGFTTATLFSYLTGSSFVFIEKFGLTPDQYALVFGFNAIGLIGASQINEWLLSRFTSWQVLSVSFLTAAIAGLLVLAVGLTGIGGMPVMIGLIFIVMSTAGIIFPNIAGVAMAPFGHVAGSASALIGTLQFGMGGIAGALVGIFHNGTLLPMTGMLALSAIAGLITLRTLAQSAR